MEFTPANAAAPNYQRKDETITKEPHLNFSRKFKFYTGHDFDNFKSFHRFSEWMHRPVDAAALGVFRMLYGAAMLVDIAEERGGSQMDLRFGEPQHCHFPLFGFIKAASLPVMGLVYFIMWLGALGIMLGYRFRWSCLAFIVPYWYIFLLDKPAWNNHSYLFGLCGSILLLTDASRYCSLDSYWNSGSSPSTVPYWNYFLIKFQFFVLYMFAGMKKLTAEWLSGYAMSSLGHHWLFTPFRSILTVEMTDLLIVHWFTAVFDFSIAFFMTWEWSRIMATPFMLSFHLMNSRLFVIGMFPWVCLAEVPLFFRLDWPRQVVGKFYNQLNKKKIDELDEVAEPQNFVKQHDDNFHPMLRFRKRKESPSTDRICSSSVAPSTTTMSRCNNYWKANLRTSAILGYCLLQIVLPYSHFITKGYNNWTNGLYGYSWDMMVHSYDTILTSIRIVDNNNQEEHYLDPYAFTQYDRWTKYADMAVQYAKCIEKNIQSHITEEPERCPLSSSNISIYFDIWCSMNGRFQQRVFDPRVDLLKAPWSPFERTLWSLPLLNELNYMRPKLKDITNDVLSWNNYSDVIFVADFPGLTLDNFISPELTNVTLTILDGSVHYRSDGQDNKQGRFLNAGQSLSPVPGEMHYVRTVGHQPSCYLYTFVNKTMQDADTTLDDEIYKSLKKPMLPLWKEFKERISNYKRFIINIGNCLMYLLYDVPIPLAVRERQ